MLQVLATGPDGAERVKFVVFPDLDRSFDYEVGVQPRTIAYPHIFADDAVGPDLYLGPEFGLGRDNGGWMNHGGEQAQERLRE